jgi:predicted enzyme related to lactoylglutathione lyase
MTPKLAAITFDCDDAAKIAAFWSALLDRPIADGSMDGYATLSGEPMMAFIKVPEPKSAKNRVHVDLSVADLAAGVERAVDLGATRHGDFDEAGFVWTTLTDPEGNEFDIVLEPPA